LLLNLSGNLRKCSSIGTALRFALFLPTTMGQNGGCKMDRGFLGWIVIGLVAGVLGKLIMPGKDPGGFIVTILLGIAGALFAGFLGQAVGLYAQGEAAGWIGATVGAIILLAIYRLVMRRRTQ
jgi:uncharacterized membrane protein YeaQ/YmgE (transglycosylase-associated protein family)